jgi:hydroxymethylpyrimidine pyrophosphatase-like HAD family hydrolase
MYAFFLDIDGTIYDGNEIAQEVTDAIAHARAAGHKVFINTARAYIGLPPEVAHLPVDGFVCAFGLEVFADGKFLHRKFLPKETVLAAAQYAFDHHVPLYFEGETRLDLNRRWESSFHPKTLAEFEQMLGTHRLCKFSLPNGPTEEDRKTFSADFDFYDIEVIPKGYSKTCGIRLVEEYYGLNREDTIAIGDSDTDLDMVRYAGIGVAMGNSTEALKAAADFVTKTLDENGAAYAIDYVLTKKADAT